MNYFAEAGNLVVVDDQNQVQWRGRPQGCPVHWASIIPGTQDALVLFAYDCPGKDKIGFANLVRLKPDIVLLWKAELPSTRDVYVHAALSEHGVEADSFEGYHVLIGVSTGKIVSKEWTK